MKQQFINQNNHQQLLLFFAGWGMDETPFLSFQPTNCDWMICYDYRSLSFDESMLRGYSSITLVAWSMGIWAASQIMKEYPCLPITQRIAINGTLFPIDETKGIAPSIFNGTLQNLDEQTLYKFQRRMCDSASVYKAFQTVAPSRSIDDLKEELAAIQTQVLLLPPALTSWQKAFIGQKDAIFLPQNQIEGWKSLAESTEEVEAAHYQTELFSKTLQQILQR